MYDSSVDAARRFLRGLGAALSLLPAACASPSVGNAPPAIVEECRREIADLTDRERLPPLEESFPEEPGPQESTGIEEDRAAEAERDGSSLAAWPEDALLYRCFTSRGVVLTEEQATVLAQWQSRAETAAPDTNE